jgi:hypothetical protein
MEVTPPPRFFEMSGVMIADLGSDGGMSVRTAETEYLGSRVLHRPHFEGRIA